MLTNRVAFWKALEQERNAVQTETVPKHWLVSMAIALVHAQLCFVGPTPTASLTITLRGADAMLDIGKMNSASAFLVSHQIDLTNSEMLNPSLFPVCSDYLCGEGAQCIATSNGPSCKCLEGFVGNPFPGSACIRDLCSPSEPCSEPYVCISGRCKQRCDGVVCGLGAHCNPNTNKCACDSFFVGNPDLICMPRKLYE